MSYMEDKAKAAPKRTYSAKTLKILFALSGNQCAEPGCSEPIIALAPHASPPSVIGQIAHILAVSEDGPRGKAGLTDKERNQAANLLLLCPTHHGKVDTQLETYPAPMLIEWKTRHEQIGREAGRETVGRNVWNAVYAETY